MKTDNSEKDIFKKQKSSKGLNESLTEDLWNDETPESDLEEYNQNYSNQVADQHVEATEKNNGEEKPPQEKKLRTILYSETKEVNGKEEAIYDDDFLKKIGNESKKFDMLNGIDFTEYITTSKEDLKRIQINPLTDLVYEITDDELYGSDWAGNPDTTKPKFGETRDIPNGNHGTKEKVISGSINVGTHKKQKGINASNLHINLGRTLAHERLAHGYNNILNNLTGNNDLQEHTHGNALTDDGGLDMKSAIIHAPSKEYKKLRRQDQIVDQTRTNVKSLHNFVNSSTNFFSSGALKYKLNTYKYTKDAKLNKHRLFSILVDKHLSGVKRAVR